jgi:hypothetical protein
MSYYLTKHARDRMAEREVTAAEVEHVLQHHGLSVPTPERSIRLEGTFPTGRTLKVWIVAVDSADGRRPLLDARGRVIVKSVAWRGEDDA